MTLRVEKTESGIIISDMRSSITIDKTDIAGLMSQLDDAQAIAVQHFENNSFWELAPEWANYFAIDNDNQLIGWFFEEEPTLDFEVSWINDETKQQSYRITHELRDRITDKSADHTILKARPNAN